MYQSTTRGGSQIALSAMQQLLYCWCEMKRMTEPVPLRRVSQPSAEAYLRTVGQRVRSERQRRGMSRRVLAETSGVSERYLAELERGAGNASVLLLRQVASALGVRIEDLASEPECPNEAAE
jgi:ribosome-binding protein aMBF1 (putative translation factor)